MGHLPRLAPFPDSHHESARSRVRGSWGRISKVFFGREGVNESSVWVDACGRECFGSPPQACAPPGLSPRKCPLASVGTLGKGQYGSPRRGGSSLPGPLPGRYRSGPAYEMVVVKGMLGVASPDWPFPETLLRPALDPRRRRGRPEGGVYDVPICQAGDCT